MTELKSNKIRIHLQDCIDIEVESNELSFENLKKESLDLLEHAKKNVMRTENYPHEVA